MTTPPLDYSMPGPYRRVEAAVANPEGENSREKTSSERSTPPYLFRSTIPRQLAWVNLVAKKIYLQLSQIWSQCGAMYAESCALTPSGLVPSFAK